MPLSFESGDEIRVSWKGIKIEGKFISSDKNITVVKLKSGYNLSLNNSNFEIIPTAAKKTNKMTDARKGDEP